MILYTQTVCPKCMGVKAVLEAEEKLDAVTFVNLDEHPEVREELKEKGFSALPILLADDTYYLEPNEIVKVILA